MSRALVALAVAFALLLVAAAGAAQSAPDVRLQVDANVVGVGDVVHVQLVASSADAMPGDPRLGSTPGLTLRAQNASPSQTHFSINGVTSDRYSLTVDWTLQADRVGSYNVGPATIMIQGRRYSAQPVSLRVVPAGQAPPRRRAPPSPFPGMPFSPFDPWRGILPDLPGDDQAPSSGPAVDPKLALDAPRGQYMFLHAALDKASAIVGEQVTFSVYLYFDPSAPNLDQDDSHEAEAEDFVKHALVRDDQEPQQVGFAQVGDRVWRVALVRKWALFPLRAGDLVVGPMSLRVTVARGGGASASRRTSEELHVRVSEPPLAGRPPGYALGDVGRFTLSTQVDPREATQGGAVGVHVELAGTGNLPSELTVPAQAGVEWLAPETHDKMGVTSADLYGGTRSFDYVVRLKTAGVVDLGELAVPYWNPERRRYDTARARLGSVKVAPSATAPAPSSDVARELLSGLPAQRDRLEQSAAPHGHLDDSSLFWLLAVGGGPLVFAASVAGRSAARRVAEAWHRRRTSPRAELEERVAAARQAAARSDAREIDAAAARAIEAATVAHVGVNVRGAVGPSDIAGRLDRAGVPHDLAERVGELLGRCEDARFSPGAVAHEAACEAARERLARARDLIRELERCG
jgi:hypothetical protein